MPLIQLNEMFIYKHKKDTVDIITNLVDINNLIEKDFRYIEQFTLQQSN